MIHAEQVLLSENIASKTAKRIVELLNMPKITQSIAISAIKIDLQNDILYLVKQISPGE